MARYGLTYQGRRTVEAYALLTPWLIGLLAFVAWPLGHSLYLTFHSTIVGEAGWDYFYVGLDNYLEAFVRDPLVVPMLLQVLQRMVIEVPIILVFSLGGALLINQEIPGRAFFRTVFFVPVVLLAGSVVRELFFQGAGTLPVLRNFDVPGLLAPYLDPSTVLKIMDVLGRIVLTLWRSGVQVLIFLAGLQAIPRSIYEAARVDGTNTWESFWHVTLPMLTPMILLNILYSIVDSFTDPLNDMLNYIQDVAFRSTGNLRPGYGSALGWIYFVMIFAILWVVIRSSRRWVFYAGERK